MNTHDDDTLRWQLRALRQDIAPQRELWPRIAERIAELPQQPVQPRREAPVRLRRILPYAMAASLLLALGVTWQALMPSPTPGEVPLRRDAALITREYQAALAQMSQAPLHPEIAPALQDLDRGAAQILSAIDRDPNSRYLLDQLRRTYARRLALTQNAVLT